MSERLLSDSIFLSCYKVTKKLITPLLFYFFISYAIWMFRVIFKIGIDEKLSLLLPLYEFITGGNQFSIVNSTLWYFLCIYNVMIVYIVMNKLIRNDYVIALVTFYLSMFAVSVNLFSVENRLLFNLDTLIVALPFFCIGRLYKEKKYLNSLFKINNKALIILLLSGGIYLVLINGKVDLNKLNYGNNYFLFYINALVGIGLILYLSHKIKFIYIRKLLLWLSLNSIFIFPLHIVVYSFITGGLLFTFGFDVKSHSGFLFSVLYIILTLMLLGFFISRWPQRINFIIGK